MPLHFEGLALRPPSAGSAEQLPTGTTPASLCEPGSPCSTAGHGVLSSSCHGKGQDGHARNEPRLTGYSHLSLGEVVGPQWSTPQELTLGAPLTAVYMPNHLTVPAGRQVSWSYYSARGGGGGNV